MNNGAQFSDGEIKVPFLNSSSCIALETDWAVFTAQREEPVLCHSSVLRGSPPHSQGPSPALPLPLPLLCVWLRGQQESDKTVPQRSVGGETEWDRESALVCV